MINALFFLAALTPGEPPSSPVTAPHHIEAPSAPAPAHPALVKEPELNLGKIKASEIQHFRITLHNPAEAPITILGITAPCGCTAVAPVQKVLAPGEDMEVPVSFDPHGYWGPLTRRIDIRTSDPAKALLVWNFTSDIQSPTIPQPKGLYLSTDETAATPATVTFRFVPTTTAIKPKSLRFEGSPKIAPEVTWRLESGEVKGTLTLDPRKLSGAQMAEERGQARFAKLLLTLDDGRTDWITVNWFIQPAIQVFPPRAAFMGQPGLVMEQKISVSAKEPFRVTSARSSNEKVKVILPTLAGPQTAFVFQIRTEGLPAGTYNEKVVLSIDSPTKIKEISVPVNAIIK